jgi:SNF2 family DNA or RNA helicase
MGESVNLQSASNAVFLDRSWNPATNAQAADRIYRIGQTKPVTITHIVARGTVDEERVLPAIANKEALRKIVLGG